MRNILLLFCLAASSFVHGQKLTFDYDFSDFRIVQTQKHSVVELKNTKNLAQPGFPMQPYYLANVLLPQGASVDNVTVEFVSVSEHQLAADILPMQHVRPLSQPGEAVFVKNEQAYLSNCVKTVGQSIVYRQSVMNGYRVAQIRFSPMEYDALNQQIRLGEQVRLTVNYSNSVTNNESMVSKRPEVLRRLNLLCENPEMAMQYAGIKDRDESIDVLIITPQAFVESFQPLVDDYQLSAKTVEILPVEDIATAYEGADLQEKIRNAIIDYYQNHDVLFVLLGGDVEHVPHRGFYCQVQSSSVYEDDNIPADLYYMALDGTWNDNGNNLWGEPDEDDLLPEVALSRMPFSTEADLTNMLNKTLTYTNNPVEGELNAPLLAGEHLYDDPLTWGAQYLDLIHGTHDDNGYTTTGIPDEHPFVTMYDRDDTWSASELMTEINSGHPFIHHVGHSNTNYAMRLYNSDITTANFNQVDGVQHNFPIIYTHGCICGAFDDNDCIAEHMLQIDRFAVAFVGNSRYGWFNEGQTEGPSQHLHREFVNALYANEVNALAEAHLISKIQSSGWVEAAEQHEYGAIRWVFYDCNAMGAPTLPMWTNEPRSIAVQSTGSIFFGADNIQLFATESGNPVENVALSVVLNDEVIGMGYTDASGMVQIALNQVINNAQQIAVYHSGYNIKKDVTLFDIGSAETGYMVVSEVAFGNDAQPVYGHQYTLSLVLENMGLASTETTHIEISSDSEFVTLQNGTVTVPVLAASATAEVDCETSVAVSNLIENGTPVVLNFDFYNGETISHSNSMQFVAQAPAFEILSVTIDDAAGGNGNGVLDAGEVVALQLNIDNLGAVSPHDLVASMVVSNPEITIINDSYNMQYIAQGSDLVLSFAVQIPAEIDDAVLEADFNVAYDNYPALSHHFRSIIGQSIEDFETGDFTKFEWVNDASKPWMVNASQVYAGSFSAQSADIADGENSELSITVNVPAADSISFRYKVSCEGSESSLWDYLEFSIDGAAMETWDGEVGWNRAVFAVTEGEHLFKWKYTKDYSVSSGDDCAWLDNIVFPMPTESVPTENSAPVISGTGQIDIESAVDFSYTFTATDADNDVLTAALVAAPEFFQIEKLTDNSWRIFGTAPADVEHSIPYVLVAVRDGHVGSAAQVIVNIIGMSIENDVQSSDLLIYPQPSSDFVTVQWEAEKAYELLVIYNMNGQMLVANPLTGRGKATIDLQALKPGMYLLQLRSSNGESVYRKIMVN